eukprot:PhF_6_TR15535/c0_g1_i1/m.24155
MTSQGQEYNFLRVLTVTLFLLHIIVVAQGQALISGDEVVCNHGLISTLCPSSSPICCLQANGAPAACCPTHTRCHLEDGTCQLINKTQTGGGGSSSDQDSSGSGGSATKALFTMSVGTAMLVGAILFLSVCVGVWCVLLLWSRPLRSSARPSEVAPLVSTEEVYGQELDTEVCAEESEVPPPEDAANCVVCLDAKIDCVILPCGHLCCCRPCSKHMRICPICRNPISERKRIRFS